MADIVVRAAGEGDVPAVAALYTEFYAYNHAIQPEYCAPAVETGDYPRKIIAAAEEDLLVAEEAGRVIGFLHVERQTAPKFPSVVQGSYAEVADLYVTEARRGAGVGKLLVEAARDWARARKLACLELLLLGNNDAGLRFYRREGFRVSAHILKYDFT